MSNSEHPNKPCQSSIINIWIRPESRPKALKLKADISEVKNLDEFASRILTKEVKVLKNVDPQKFVFLDNKNRTVQPDTYLQLLAEKTTRIEPIVVRYPLSSANIVVNFMYGRMSGRCEISHTSDSLSKLKAEVKEKFDDFEDEEIYFLYGKKEIRKEHHFSTIVNQTKLKGNNRLLMLKVMDKNRKQYSDWDSDGVLQVILREKYSSFTMIPILDFHNLPPLKEPFSKRSLKAFTRELRKKSIIYRKTPRPREYLSIFLTEAVYYAQQHVNKNIWICNGWELGGSYGHGSLDRAMFIRGIIVPVRVAEAEDMNKGIAQVLVQMHSAIEDITQDYETTPSMFGIASTGDMWQFVCWTGSLENPTIHISMQYNCNFTNDMEIEKEVLTYITQILQFINSWKKN